MGAITILDMTMKYATIAYSILDYNPSKKLISYPDQISFLKNVDAGAAKELMTNLVKLQSSLSEVNQYVNFVASNIIFYLIWSLKNKLFPITLLWSWWDNMPVSNILSATELVSISELCDYVFPITPSFLWSL